MLHTDLKPENILIDCEGSPKILDFNLMEGGISDQLSSSPTYYQCLQSPDYRASPRANQRKPSLGGSPMRPFTL
ncbi:hypothetical protein O9993_04865 [Vibrio lentus]|nr:hypothetical protein [Vibrio lentus]